MRYLAVDAVRMKYLRTWEAHMEDQDHYVKGILMIASIVVALFAAAAILIIFTCSCAHAHEHSRPDLNQWFDSLKSPGFGPCCSNSDGTALSDVDWESIDGHYRVRLNGVWYNVPDDAVLTQPNLAGTTMVWPVYQDGVPSLIRCFIPGSMT